MAIVELRRRVTAGLNKGEAGNALARAVFFNLLGEIRDSSYEQQRYRVSGLTLATAAIILLSKKPAEPAMLCQLFVHFSSLFISPPYHNNLTFRIAGCQQSVA